jgi:hypothetical protein
MLTTMKSIPILLLYGTVCHASITQLQSPPAPEMSGILGPLDLAKYGPMLKPYIPAANAFADSGGLLKYVKSFAPTLKLVNKTTLEPQLRKTAKRAKVRLGPFKLEGKGVRKYHFGRPIACS